MFCRAECTTFDGSEALATPGFRPLIELRQAQGQRQPAANVTVRLHAAHSAFLACKSHRSSHPAWWESVEAPSPSKDPTERTVKALAAVGRPDRARFHLCPSRPPTHAAKASTKHLEGASGVGRVSRPAYRLRRTRRTSSIPRLHAAHGGFAPRSPNTAFQEALDEA